MKNYKDWLSTKIPNSNIYYENFLFTMYVRLRDWIDRNEDINRFVSNLELYLKFKFFIYSEYVKPLNKYNYDFQQDDYYEIFNMKYSDDIVNLFLYFKDYSKSLNVNLFNNRGDTSYPFLEFIYSVCDYNDIQENEEIYDISENENEYEIYN
jgi:hypothetical protein